MPSSRFALLEQYFLANVPLLRRFIRKKLNNTEASTDVLHETYVAMRRCREPERIANPRSFLFTIASNLAVNWIRSRSARRTLEGLPPDVAEVAVPGADPAKCAERNELNELVGAAIDELPGRCREVFLLHRFEGRTHAEIAAELGISKHMVAKHIFRAMKHLRERLDGTK